MVYQSFLTAGSLSETSSSGKTTFLEIDISQSDHMNLLSLGHIIKARRIQLTHSRGEENYIIIMIIISGSSWTLNVMVPTPGIMQLSFLPHFNHVITSMLGVTQAPESSVVMNNTHILMFCNWFGGNVGNTLICGSHSFEGLNT